MKKISFLTLLIVLTAVFLTLPAGAKAATPTLSLVSNGDGDTVQINVNGDPSVGVLLFYSKTNIGSQISSLGTTNASGYLSVSISSSGYGIANNSTVYVKTNGLNGLQSASVAWPTISLNGVFSLNPTGLVMTVGQSSAITANNTGSNSLYLSNNSNPQVAVANINGSQINVSAIGNGSTVLTICALPNSQNSQTNCASAYVTVQNSGAQALTFSLSNVTVAIGQSVPITISGGNGSYSVFNNANSSVIQTGISGNTITLSTTATSGSSAITVCASDMGACGIINATAASTSTAPLSFTPQNPTVSIGQSLSVMVSGGTSGASYYVSSNSNTAALTTSINGNNLQLTGNSNGSANVVVCASSGGCGTLAVTVSYVSYGGVVTFSQSSITLLVGQVLSVTVSGGTTPYTISGGQSNMFQTSLNGNIVTLSGISSGASSLNVCSAGGACATLQVTINASGAGTPITFSQNNLNLSVGNVTALTISGSGGYYVSTSANPDIATVQITGNTALVTALATGNNNISICQSGGQCAILFITVASSGSTATPVPAFSQTNPTLSAGQVLNETISGGSGGNYYILANTNPTAVQLSLTGSQLTLTGLTGGSSTIAVCAAQNSCSVLTVMVTGTAPSAIYFTTTSLTPGTVGQVYGGQILAAGGNGSYTFVLTSGSLPDGLTLSSGGGINGTPTASGTNNMAITATDSSGNSTGTNFTLLINPVVPTSPVTTAATGYTNGQLISENGTIYMVYQNTKVGFSNAAAFLGLGFKFNNVTPANDSGLAVSPKIVITADGQHPRGTWVVEKSTVYFVTPQGLIPVPSWDIFLSNGGQASFIVKADSYDLAAHRLPVMTANDARLHP
jgi:hypothetical protein